MKEWYLSSELVGLDGMANSATGVSQKAKRNNWLSRKSASGSRALEYHISNFHPDVKRQVIEKYVTDLDEAEYLLTASAPRVMSNPVDMSVGAVDIGSSQTSQQATSRASRNTDDNVTEISNVKSVKATSQIGDMCAVPVYNVYASCGFGAQNDTEYQLRTEFLPCLWLKRFGLTEEDARIIICHGDSMEDTLSDGDEVLVDTRELDHPVKHGVYVVRIGKHVYIKRLKYDIMAEGYNVISDNKEEYDSFIVNEEKLDEFAVIGKVVTTVMKAVI
ncbi:helix-turn-helix domain-containing protein [Vibrio splendidus]|uniref:helix-turn-helix domain-containing protein n=1 Tax=Vibrio splendidus TaxID=29497 RepID=UPI000D336771|nr:S24 family peptidase [Vibrio splendidus]PTP90478.1 transcriptional regulator [Vibrio splendidus]